MYTKQWKTGSEKNKYKNEGKVFFPVSIKCVNQTKGLILNKRYLKNHTTWHKAQTDEQSPCTVKGGGRGSFGLIF